MKPVTDYIPWQVTDISLRPVDGFWSFNPSLVNYNGEWIANLRLCDYCLPGGKVVRSPKSRPGGNITKNYLVWFDSSTWKPIKTHLIEEKDGHGRIRSANIGFEDMRLFSTDAGGLQGISSSLHLTRPPGKVPGLQQHQPPEQVLLSFDKDYDISHAHPIRGDWWSGTPQKNWVPFDNVTEPRFLYSIGKGTMFGTNGALSGEAAGVTPSVKSVISQTFVQTSPRGVVPAAPVIESAVPVALPAAPQSHRPLMVRGGGEIKLSGRRSTHDASNSRMIKSTAAISVNTGTRLVGTGRALPPRYAGLRGGTQLIRVATDQWLGIGHEMRYERSKKLYWHNFYLVDSRGKMLAVGPSVKLATSGVEFAAGMGIDGDRVAVSYGVDDYESKIGVTSLSAVMDMLTKGDK